LRAIEAVGGGVDCFCVLIGQVCLWRAQRSRLCSAARFPRTPLRLGAVSVVALLAFACGGDNSPIRPTPPAAEQPVSPGSPLPGPPLVVPDAVLVGAGDVAMCGVPEVETTARLLEGISGTVMALGDLAYPRGSANDFAACYEPTWGRVKARTRPAPGNHDYETPGAAAYYAYFGENAGPSGLGYYSYRAGAWLVLSLNSNIPAAADSPQAAWVRATLAANPTPCTLAYWHHPLFSSGPNGDTAVMREIWTILQQGGADVVVAAHDHLYERFAPQDATGRPDPRRGLREFVVGTGGAHLYAPKATRPNSEVISSTHGVLKLTLKPESYEWQFVPIPGKPFTDFGTAPCNSDRGITETTFHR
jgi:3',5'-cyclic AMP phosphodiesterase CpdA